MSEPWSIIDEETYATSGETYEYIDDTTEAGVSYEYRVKAVGHGAAIDSEYSNTIVAGKGASQLQAPLVVGQQTYYGCYVSWQIVTNADQYLIAYKLHTDEEWVLLNWSSIITEQSKCFLELMDADSKVWDFKIIAGSSSGDYIASEWSNVVSITCPEQGKLHTPEVTRAEYYKVLTGGNSGVKVYWKYGTSADYAVIERKLSTASTWTQVGVETASNEYFDDIFVGLHGQTWQYRVKFLKDGWIDSDYSAVYSLTLNFKLNAPTLTSVDAYDFDRDGPVTGWSRDEAALIVRWGNIDYRASLVLLYVSNNNGSTWYGPYTISTQYGGYYFTSADILPGGKISIRIAVKDESGYYITSDYSSVVSHTFKQRTYFYSDLAYQEGRAIDPSGLTGGWKNGRDSESGTISDSMDSNGVKTVQAAGSTYGYRISKNPVSLSGYSKLCAVGVLTKPSRDAQSRFGTCRYTGDSTGVGCWSLKYDALGTYATGTLTNPSITSFTTNNDTHLMLFMSKSGSAKINRIFAIKN